MLTEFKLSYQGKYQRLKRIYALLSLCAGKPPVTDWRTPSTSATILGSVCYIMTSLCTSKHILLLWRIETSPSYEGPVVEVHRLADHLPKWFSSCHSKKCQSFGAQISCGWKRHDDCILCTQLYWIRIMTGLLSGVSASSMGSVILDRWGNEYVLSRKWLQYCLAVLCSLIQYIPRNMHTVFALLCFVVVIHWLIFPHPPGLLHWHCGNLTIAPVPAKQPWWIWINTSCEFIMNDCITTTKKSTTKRVHISWDILYILHSAT